MKRACRTVARNGVRGEVLVADNGSTDGSQQLATAKGARLVAARDRGYGSALRHGTLAARGRYVVMGDADDSYDLSHLEDFVENLRQGYDVVLGNRFQGGIAPGAMPFLHRYLGNPKVVKGAYGARAKDTSWQMLPHTKSFPVRFFVYATKLFETFG